LKVSTDGPATAGCYSPREVADAAGISTDTLRYYERCGVLPKPARTRAGYRRYPASAVARVALIRRSLTIGFSIKQLARVFEERAQGGAPCGKVRAIVGERLARIDEELAALTALKGELSTLLDEWDAKLAVTPPGRPAKLLETLPVSGGAPCTKK
jgi:DNA-binding transcriptional MerR regulator